MPRRPVPVRKKPRPVGNAATSFLAVLHLVTPGRVGGLKSSKGSPTEVDISSARRTASIVPSSFMPFAAEYHIRHTPSSTHKSTVEGGAVGGAIILVGHRQVRTVGLVANEHIRCAARYSAVGVICYDYRIVGKGGEIIVLAIIGCISAAHMAGCLPVHDAVSGYATRRGPSQRFEVAACPHQAPGAGHIIHLRGAVGKYTRIAEDDRIARHILCGHPTRTGQQANYTSKIFFIVN